MAQLILEGCGIHSRRQFLRLGLIAGSLPVLTIPTAHVAWSQQSPKPTWQQVTDTIRRHLAQRQGYQPGDLITRGDVTPVFAALQQLGWNVPERDKIVGLLLDDGHFLVRECRTAAGTKFMRGVARQSLVFDRLDRLSNMPGGQQLIHDMMRLPNGQQLMSKKPTQGFTDLTILLPKQANGKTPRDKDFGKPTGKIYTEPQLVQTLEKSWSGAKV